MTGYVLLKYTVSDPELYKKYTEAVVPSATTGFDFKVCALRMVGEGLEGEQTVLAEFPTVEDAQAWYQTEAHYAIEHLRHEGAEHIRVLLLNELTPIDE